MAPCAVAGSPFAESVVAIPGAGPAMTLCQAPMKSMKPADLPRELVYPFSDMSILLAMTGFWLLGSLAKAGGMLGLWLGAILLPAFFRYALYILDARSKGQEVPALGIEMFTWVENNWSLFPLVLLCGYVWAAVYLANNVSILAALLSGVFLLIIFPASMAVLSVTRSPMQSLNPVAITTMIRSCGWEYGYVVLTMPVLLLVMVYILSPVLPDFIMQLLWIYAYFLAYSLTGAVVESAAVVADVSIPDAIEMTADEHEERRTADRMKVANHAYGFVSRGNRAGGLAHIQSFIDGEQDKEEAYNWFFNQMLKWENTDAALLFAQSYLHQLLSQQRDTAALKLLSQSYHANPRFRPAKEDAEAAIELAKRNRRDDLLKFL